jgi:hypothetical protein
MTTVKKFPLYLVLFLFSTQIFSQEGSLQNLVGGKASSTEMDLESRGYRLISTRKDHYASYTNWWSDDKNKCISVKTADGRTASIIKMSPADCGQYGTNAYNNYSPNDYNAHSNHYASSAHEAAYEKGYNDGRYNRGWHNYYYTSSEKEGYNQGYNNGVIEKDSNKNHSSSYGGHQNSAQYKDMKGWVAHSAYDVLHQRGFREVERYKKDRLWIVWEHNTTRKCIKTGEDNGKIQEVMESDKCN